MNNANKYFGKYRGFVIGNVDPLQTGRLMVQVADVSGVLPSTWAMPCLPFAGTLSGFYAVPEIGSQVWIEFEQGDPDYPIWVGCFWGSATDVPALALAGTPGLQQIVVQTTGQNTLLISDTPGPTGGIMLQSSAGALISVSDAGITISNGQGATITMTGPSVTVNEGALEVT
ncbi:MAG TPA: phage baseplate assembly protein V [Streptosporangiaceae bacterium]|nr:phage baseplate assembly protein V [Streptosporangiaceae bacterium]